MIVLQKEKLVDLAPLITNAKIIYVAMLIQLDLELENVWF